MDAVSLPDFFELVEYWELSPPEHVTLRAIALALGLEQKEGGKASAPKHSSPAEIQALVAKFQS